MYVIQTRPKPRLHLDLSGGVGGVYLFPNWAPKSFEVLGVSEQVSPLLFQTLRARNWLSQAISRLHAEPKMSTNLQNESCEVLSYQNNLIRSPTFIIVLAKKR